MSTIGVRSHLSVMEAFANLIPGIVLLIGIRVSLSAPVGADVPVSLVTGPLDAVALVIFAILSFVVGMVIQGFGKMAEHKLDPKGEKATKQIGGLDIGKPFGRISMSTEIQALDEDRPTYFQKEFWELCQKEFSFSDGAIGREDARELWRFIRTYLVASPYSLNTRYHALNNMSRGMWASFGILFLYYLIVIGLALLTDVSTVGTGVLGSLAVISGVFMLAFGQIKNQFKELWFKTLIFEYYLLKNEQLPD